MITTYDLMAAHPFLTGLPLRHIERLSRYASRAPFHANTRIFQEHGTARGWWLIRDGFVNLDLRVPGRGDVIVETLGPGAVLGWSWLFPPYRWAFGAVAASPVEAFEFDGRMVRACCESDPALGYELTRRLARVVAKRLQATRVRLITTSSQPAGAR